jgi:hypothetical protein
MNESGSQTGDLNRTMESVRNCENRLRRIHIKHNIQLSEIQELKEELNVSRRERVINSTVFKSIERDVIGKQNEYRELILQSEMMKEEIRALMDSMLMLQGLSE